MYGWGCTCLCEWLYILVGACGGLRLSSEIFLDFSSTYFIEPRSVNQTQGSVIWVVSLAILYWGFNISTFLVGNMVGLLCSLGKYVSLVIHNSCLSFLHSKGFKSLSPLSNPFFSLSSFIPLPPDSSPSSSPLSPSAASSSFFLFWTFNANIVPWIANKSVGNVHRNWY